MYAIIHRSSTEETPTIFNRNRRFFVENTSVSVGNQSEISRKSSFSDAPRDLPRAHSRIYPSCYLQLQKQSAVFNAQPSFIRGKIHILSTQSERQNTRDAILCCNYCGFLLKWPLFKYCFLLKKQPSKFNRNSIEIQSNSIEIQSKSIEIQSKFNRNSIEIQSKFNRNSIEIQS